MYFDCSYANLATSNISADSDSDLHEFNNAYALVRKAMLHTNEKGLIDAVDWSAKVVV